MNIHVSILKAGTQYGGQKCLQEGYGQFCVDLEENLNKKVVLKLATIFEFTPAEKGTLRNDDEPASVFVDLLKEKGKIKEDNITDLMGALDGNGYHGILDKVRRSFEKNVKISQGEITDAPPVNEESEVPDSSLNPEGVRNHEEFPYLSISDFEEYKDDPDDLRAFNRKSAGECKKLFEHYTLESNQSGEQSPPSSCVDHLRVVMVGKTGSGKSATANSLLGGEFFYHGASASSVTESSGIATSEISNSRRISVIDSPGLKDTAKTDEEVMRELARVAYLLREGVHVFLFVWNGSDCRFSESDGDAITLLMEEFKEKFTKRCLVVYSKAHGTLKSITLDAFIDEQKEHPKMKTFLDQIGGKVVAVNNKTEIPAEQKRNQNVLIDMIDGIVRENQGKVYTNKVFQEAQTMHKKVVAQCNKFHPALVSAVIELYNSNSAGFSSRDKLYAKVLKILEKSNTGKLLGSDQGVMLTDGNGQQILSYEEYGIQIWKLYEIVDSGMKDFLRFVYMGSYSAVGALKGAKIGYILGGRPGAVAGAVTGAVTSAVTSKLTSSVGSAVNKAVASTSAGKMAGVVTGTVTSGALTYGAAAGAFFLEKMLAKRN